MLRAPAEFPMVGSYALIDHEDKRWLARILGRNPDGTVAIALPERPNAGGNLTVPFDRLLDGTALTLEEQAEKSRLYRTRKSKAERNRWNELDARDLRSRMLAGKLCLLDRSQRRAA